MSQRPLIVHIIFRFDYGGLENGLVNVINGLADEPVRHAVIALSEASDFAGRLRDDVDVFALGKQPGKDPRTYLRLWKLLRRLKPAVVHTRNLGTLDCVLIAFLAGVPVRIHGEHGWDVFDPDGTNRKYKLMRRLLAPFVSSFVAVSRDLSRWLVDVVGISTSKVQHICNGVDALRFSPRQQSESSPVGKDLVVGSVTRFSAIKDPLNLVKAFTTLRSSGLPIHLLMVGDGELMTDVRALLRETNTHSAATLPGSRDDIPELLRKMDIFVLGSLREGISNTILEAMASGLPVIASDTGGNSELVKVGSNGMLVPPGDEESLANAIRDYVQDPDSRVRHGRASRDRVMSTYSLERMIEKYRTLYDQALQKAGR